jgi:hypothetical protein
MFDAVKKLADLGEAVRDQLATVNDDQLGDHLQTAAANIQTNGLDGYAQQATSLAQPL